MVAYPSHLILVGTITVTGAPSDATPDAVPKKRGPKTDVLEALLKRVDGLEKRLHTEGKSDDADDDTQQSPVSEAATDTKSATASQPPPQVHAARPSLEIAPHATNAASQLISPIEPRCL
jgi:hypothetical protein